jgi:GNAT superfamily N-acetyltransferase
MHIRPYAPTDWPRLCEIHDQARLIELRGAGLLEAFLTLEQTAENEGLFAADLIVAEAEGQVLGFAAFDDGELTWLYVDPAQQRKGVGRALIRRVIQACPGQVETEVLVGNDGALALYLSEGFVVLHRTDGKLVGNESFAASGYALRRVPPVVDNKP